MVVFQDRMYREITNHIQVEAHPLFVREESRPEENYYFFSYTIRITNLGTIASQLLSRHWIITDGTGVVREVRGDGVIGEQPRIEPGKSFEYTSFCPLPTPTGNMRGSYQMMADDGARFEARIPLFFLRDFSKYN